MKIVSREELTARLRSLREQGRTVVFTNGCFDLLHVGHVRYLAQARSLGDALVVGVNTDSSVRRLKGEGRPIVPQEERAEVLAALACVDWVTLFEEPTPEALLADLRPQIHVKGGDYRAEDLPETPLVQSWGGRVIILPFTPGRSTTRLLEALRAPCSALRVGRHGQPARRDDRDPPLRGARSTEHGAGGEADR
jgi:D-beta-D-heptose 7-phosphate kinase/D-beta-D-heptose 1-phosphate adenosyltransferase